ncbi:hypothetical protein M670_01389 [Schinkia azotoformans MEV2011]|uniref:Uncharacterized protein n=1 Tax=Schinkia azotoformans MEV2011 TaxID=1348973 RepID=A0A072NQY3_SCHAZ|nr:hypothetical protein M670_01389 [Schinkia azotoformans MEV2011]
MIAFTYYSSSIPKWGVGLFCSMLIITVIFGLLSLFQKKISPFMNIFVIIFPFLILVVSFLYSMGRPYGNEIQWFFIELTHFKIWSVFVAIGCLYIIFWWFLYFSSYKK